MFCQIRILDVLRLIKFQFYGRTKPYEQFVLRGLFPRTIHFRIPYGWGGMLWVTTVFLVAVFVSSQWHILHILLVFTKEIFQFINKDGSIKSNIKSNKEKKGKLKFNKRFFRYVESFWWKTTFIFGCPTSLKF